MQTIYKEILRCKNLGLRGVLGTIISTQGSTYQKNGAKCFIAEDGKLTGLVSGGCVEGDIKEIALQIIEEGQPKIIHYDFQDKGDLIWGLGLGCNGKINILLEPYIPTTSESELFEEWFKQGMDKTLHSIIVVEAANSSLVGSKWIIDPETQEYNHIPFKEIINDYVSKKDLQSNYCKLENIDGNERFQVFYDSISPSPRLVVFGAGPDAIPLVQMAKQIEWHVTVLDHRPGYINQKNFREADELINFKAGAIPEITLKENTYVVIMSHHFLHDQMMLKEVINSEAAYIGLLGPRKRTYELGKSLGITNHPNLHKIHSPIGLDIGSVTPEEIGLSILAEILMVFRGGTGNKLTKGMINFSSKEEEQLLEI
ncbi:XdhC family protein [Bacillus sp. ISL-53]|uniref:XdhC family protein n=1 Tax=unclassified Bacillus (in: firmicutes) TaxID=185979 RepID=UPI001BE8FB98|nr:MULTISPECIES: XdhC/CoxI family protein [unclassified Bacillus (in: firmicutes)]MBT2605200.1 XdhC family protein [Bacillus sp. ISL-53]MBT2613904.1 XdhC family protein [Bacillus sp. ISL-78]MBT2627783.1 XdhC family protein [Bacillus sp. ISL-101]MBT2717492.1 XdhC family protein [Bacillus sp. ISL-57]